MKYTHELYKDNAGALHLAILNDSGDCVYYLTDLDHALVLEALADFKAGGDPIADGWEGGEADPAACYQEITDFVDRRNGSAWDITEDAELC